MHTALAIISTPLYLHSVLMISRTSSLIFPYKTFFLYFGMKTIGYWHFQTRHLIVSLYFIANSCFNSFKHFLIFFKITMQNITYCFK